MDIETVIETCLREYAPIRGKDLKCKVEERGYSVSRTQFYRYGAKLKKAGKLDQVNGVWYWRENVQSKSCNPEYPSTPENWDSLLNVFSKVGANLVDVELEKAYETTKPVIKGIIVLRGAKKLQEIIKMYIPDEYEAYLLTKETSLEKNDTVTWQEKSFTVKEIEDIYDIYTFNYRVAKLAKYVYKPGPAWVLG